MKFITEPNQLTIWLQGLEQLWALKRRIQIPHFAIAEINYVPEQPVMQDFSGYLRAPGTVLPWHFLAGSYHGRQEREFWYVRMRVPGILVIDLKKDTLRYGRIRLSCDPETAQTIADWWRSGKGK